MNYGRQASEEPMIIEHCLTTTIVNGNRLVISWATQCLVKRISSDAITQIPKQPKSERSILANIGDSSIYNEALSKTLTEDELFYLKQQFALLEPSKNGTISLDNIISELGLSPSIPVHAVLHDWIRHTDGKLSFLGFVKLLHGVSSRSLAKAH
ncbi:UNVERIFIED_CONTAM: CDPK-related protein kinase [Sesamum calycinum]|uniref:CDPK-related protein kinase n=1 Tax=Sesamum calycinum TaxID=2727403 RepID=A0AAW2S9P6_9LAMI